MFKSALLASVMAITTRAINLDTENQLELHAENDLNLNNAIDAASSDDSSSNGGGRGRVRLFRGLAKRGLRLGNGGGNRRRGSSSSNKHQGHNWHSKARKARAPPKAKAPEPAVVEVVQDEPLKIEPYLKIDPLVFPKFEMNTLPHFGKLEPLIQVQAKNDIDVENADKEVEAKEDMPDLLKEAADGFAWVFGADKDDEQVVDANEQVVGADEQEGDEVNGVVE